MANPAVTRQNVDNVSNNIGKTEALTDTATVQQVEKISNLVRDYYREYHPQAENIERGCQNYVDNLIDDLINKLKQDKRFTDSFGLENIQRNQRDLSRRINGAITNRLEMDLSLDNYECRQILKMSPGSDKNQKMKDFANKVINEAKENLSKMVSRILYEQIADISYYLERKVNQQERDTENAQKEFERWVKDMENNAYNQEQAQLQPAIKLYAIEQVEKIIKDKAA